MDRPVRARSHPDGKPWGSRFPLVSVRDQVEADIAALEALGITEVAAVVGGSMGGARALEWIVGHPDKVRAALVLAVGARATADQIGTQSTQVAAIKSDPNWCNGDYYDTGLAPDIGMEIARRFAHLTYRGEAELDDRFANDPQGDEDPTTGGRYAVQSYLEYQGRKLLARFDAGTYVALTESLSSHDVGRGRGGVRGGAAKLPGAVVVGGITSDRLYPLRLQEELAELLPGCTELNVVDSVYGHDGFLVETEAVGELIRQTLELASKGDRAVTSSQQRSLSFGAEAAAYERGRPSYPPEAIDWLLPTEARDVLDLGAGTGKLTTRLVERGLDVVAVDPIPEMLELLSNSLPDTPALLGTAEEIPLPDDSVDAVLVAQAWHWFDPERAVKEVARVLRPGGRLGPGVEHPRRAAGLGQGSRAGSSATRTPVQRHSHAARRRSPMWNVTGRVDELPDAAGTHRSGRLAQLLHHLAGGGAHPYPRPGPRAAGHPSRAGQFQRPGAALRHGGHPRDAFLNSLVARQRFVRLEKVVESRRLSVRRCASWCPAGRSSTRCTRSSR